MKNSLARLITSVIVLSFICGLSARAQDTLPDFTIENAGNGRIVISWRNPYPNLIQVAVQRSVDSLKRFSTVYSATSPELPVNGFADQNQQWQAYYYRIFYVMQGGAYFFTASKKVQGVVTPPEKKYQPDSRRDMLDAELSKFMSVKDPEKAGFENYDPNKIINIIVKDTLYEKVLLKDFRRFRDSVMTKTQDTLVQKNDDSVYLYQYIPPYVQRISPYVFTDRDGYVVVKLTDAAAKRYELVFLEEDDSPVLEFKNIKDTYFIIDKVNFYHGGWFKFELKENGRIKERNKIYLPKDFGP
jgi:hypothetical protein